jgi:hypothetical protein
MTRRRHRTVFGQPVFWVWTVGILFVVALWGVVPR